jgi:hypothetical protein
MNVVLTSCPNDRLDNIRLVTLQLLTPLVSPFSRCLKDERRGAIWPTRPFIDRRLPTALRFFIRRYPKVQEPVVAVGRQGA